MTLDKNVANITPHVANWLIKNKVRAVSPETLLVFQNIKTDIIKAMPTLKDDPVLREGVWEYVNAIDEVVEYNLALQQSMVSTMAGIHTLVKKEFSEAQEKEGLKETKVQERSKE